MRTGFSGKPMFSIHAPHPCCAEPWQIEAKLFCIQGKKGFKFAAAMSWAWLTNGVVDMCEFRAADDSLTLHSDAF